MTVRFTPQARGRVLARDPRASEFFARFSAATTAHLLAERFDYDAARLWAASTHPPVLPDQSSLIRRLMSRRKSAISTPLSTSREEQDPYFGVWSLAMLVNDQEHLELKYANRNGPFLNDRPPTLPPRPQRIHICWGIGWDGAVQDAPLREDKENGVAAGSILQWVVALIVDDWRTAFRDLPIELELHRLSPAPTVAGTGKGRRRWSDLDPHVPPAEALGALFERVNYAQTLDEWALVRRERGELTRRQQSGASQEWWCAFVLDADLPALGFPPGNSAVAAELSRVATKSLLPPEIDHVVVVPLSPGAGTRFRVGKLRAEVTTLDPQPGARTGIADEDYWSLRVAALDLALGELAARMR